MSENLKKVLKRQFFSDKIQNDFIGRCEKPHKTQQYTVITIPTIISVFRVRRIEMTEGEGPEKGGKGTK